MRELPGWVRILLWSTALAQVAGAADLDEIKRRGVLRVIIAGTPDTTNSRFCSVDKQGQFVGLEGELLRGFAKLHGVEAQPVFVSAWELLIPTVLKGQGDLIAGGVTDTPARRKLIAFTAETFPTRNVVITRKPHRVVETLAQLREERVGVAYGTAYGEAVRQAGVPPERVDESFPIGQSAPRDALKTGRVTATVEGLEIALMSDLENGTLQLGVFLGPPESLAFGLRKEDQQLRTALDAYITNVRRTPTWNRLVVKYFGERAIDLLRRLREP